MNQTITAYKLNGKGISNINLFARKIFLQIENSELVITLSKTNQEIFRSHLTKLQVGENLNKVINSGYLLPHLLIKSGDKFLRIRFTNPVIPTLLLMVVVIVGIVATVGAGVMGTFLTLLLIFMPTVSSFRNREAKDADARNFLAQLQANGVGDQPIIDPELEKTIHIVEGGNRMVTAVTIGILYPVIVLLGSFIPRPYIKKNFNLSLEQDILLSLAIATVLFFPVIVIIYKLMMKFNNKNTQQAREDLGLTNTNKKP